MIAQHLFFRFFLRCGRLRCRLFLGLGVCLALLRPAPHRASDCSGTCAFTGITRDSANCCASGGSPGCPANTTTLRLRGVLGSLILSEFLFFFTQPLWRRSLGVDSSALLGLPLLVKILSRVAWQQQFDKIEGLL